VGATQEKLVLREGEVRVRKIAIMGLSVDHRVAFKKSFESMCDNPVNLGSRETLFQCKQKWEAVHDITERTRFNNENFPWNFHFKLQTFYFLSP